MTQILQSLAEVSDRYDALFCDLWGCVHNGQRPFPDAVAALQAYRARGGRVALLTNAPRPSPSVIRQLDRIGVARDAWDIVVTSGDASRAAMLGGAVGRSVFHIGADKDESFFTETHDGLDPGLVTRTGLDAAEGIVCTGLADDLTQTPEDYRAELTAGRARGLKLLCTNPDIVVDMGETRVFCAGAVAQLYERMGGETIYCGKPHPQIYDLARLRLTETMGEVPASILCIGDGILTDVAGGIAEDLDTLFVTDGLAAAEFGDDPQNPDPARLEAWLKTEGLDPLFSIGALR